MNVGGGVMWDTATYCFDVAVVFGIFAVGNILMGHFEEHRPKWRRLLKVALVLGLALWLSWMQLRWILYLVLGIAGMAALYIHAIWLPKHGINGWTGEPRESYLRLVTKRPPK